MWCTDNGILAIKKNEIMPFVATWIDLEIIILSEVSQTGRQISYDITYMWNLKKIPMNLFTKQKQTHRHRKQTCQQREKGENKLGVWD